MTDDPRFFDACSIADPVDAHSRSGALTGLLIYGDVPNATPASNVLRAACLSCLVGANDPRFPRSADVLDLHIDEAELIKNLKEPPAHWWPLCGSAREDGKPTILHINAAEFGSLAKGLTRLARAFPAIKLIIDPYLGGKASKWLAGVCLADEPNIWLTTRGLFAADVNWPERSEREALYFTIGEVGAGKLLFASGMTAKKLDTLQPTPAEWLERIPFLDAAQRALILRENAAAVF